MQVLQVAEFSLRLFISHRLHLDDILLVVSIGALRAGFVLLIIVKLLLKLFDTFRLESEPLILGEHSLFLAFNHVTLLVAFVNNLALSHRRADASFRPTRHFLRTEPLSSCIAIDHSAAFQIMFFCREIAEGV